MKMNETRHVGDVFIRRHVMSVHTPKCNQQLVNKEYTYLPIYLLMIKSH